MPPSLGICVTTKGTTHHVLGLAQAAARAGVSTEVFLTGEGVQLVSTPGFRELLARARVSVCEASFLGAGLSRDQAAGLADKDFVTQWRNAEMVERCDRYLIL